MLPLLLVLALCTGVVSSAPCLADGNGFNVASGSALTCNCGTTTCKNSQEGCDEVANKCVCPPGSAWGKVPVNGIDKCIVCGPYTATHMTQTWYTSGYQCVGGSTTVVGDGKTICPVGTVDRRECDTSNCQKTGTTACTSCANGQYQDEEGKVFIWDFISQVPQWYVKYVYWFFFFFSLSLCLFLMSNSLSLQSSKLTTYFHSFFQLLTHTLHVLQQSMPWGTLHDSHWTDEFGRLQEMSGRMGQ